MRRVRTANGENLEAARYPPTLRPMPERKKCEQDVQDIIFPSGKLGKPLEREFRKLFNLWVDVSRRYADHWGRKKTGAWKEVHWWYRERANVGMFAAAVWQANGVALEEYGSEKTFIAKKRKSKYRGRTDLCFSLPLSGRNFAAETKHTSSKLLEKRKGEPSFHKIIEGLEAACKDAGGVRGQGELLGMVFVTLDLPKATAGRTKVSKVIADWTKRVRNDSRLKDNPLKQCLFISWFFPTEARLLADNSTWKPGTAMFVAPAKAFTK